MSKTRWKSHGHGVVSKIRKKDGKRVFYIRYSYQGKRITEKVGTGETRARGRIEARRELMEDPNYVPPQVKRRRASLPSRVSTFADFGSLFMEQYASKRKATNTWFRPMVDRLTKTFGKKRLDAITRLDVERFLTERAKSKHAATVNHDIRFLKLMFKTAVAWKFLLAAPPTDGVALLRVPPPTPEEEGRRFLTINQTNALIEAASDHIVPIVQLALLTGMRRGELLKLRWPQIRNGTIRLHDTKSGKERCLPATDEIEAILRGVRGGQTVVDLGQHVFLYRGKPMREFKTAWESTRERANLPFARFHDLRHTWASRLLQRDVALFDLMKLGGWSSLEMVTRRYGHFAADDQRAAMELLSGTVGDVQ